LGRGNSIISSFLERKGRGGGRKIFPLLRPQGAPQALTSQREDSDDLGGKGKFIVVNLVGRGKRSGSRIASGRGTPQRVKDYTILLQRQERDAPGVASTTSKKSEWKKGGKNSLLVHMTGRKVAVYQKRRL